MQTKKTFAKFAKKRWCLRVQADNLEKKTTTSNPSALWRTKMATMRWNLTNHVKLFLWPTPSGESTILLWFLNISATCHPLTGPTERWAPAGKLRGGRSWARSHPNRWRSPLRTAHLVATLVLCSSPVQSLRCPRWPHLVDRKRDTHSTFYILYTLHVMLTCITFLETSPNQECPCSHCLLVGGLV